MPDLSLAGFQVSRETIRRLEILVETLAHWNKRINLVAPRSLAEVWTRHILDSAQLFALRPPGATLWADLGSGAGFPGLVVAALAAEAVPELRIVMVESDRRKCAFLRHAARAMGVTVSVLERRVESVPGSDPHRYDVISARALATLPRLLELSAPLAAPGAILLFPKGGSVDSELTEAKADWHIRCERIASRTDPSGTILRISEYTPRHAD